MLDKKIVKNILLEVDNYEEYLNEVIERVLNKDEEDVKYLIARENEYLTLYKYSECDYIQWLYEYKNYDIYDIYISEFKNNKR